MTIPSQDSLNEISAYLAMRDSDHASKNAEQLLNWQRRSFRDPVKVDAPTQPPKWPAFRSSIEGSSVIQLKRRAKG